MELFVVGAGYVGLSTAVGSALLGHRVTVYDIDPDRIESLSAGRSPILEVGMDDGLAAGLAAGRLRFTDDPRPPATTDLAMVCVPTPIGPDGVLDLSIVEVVVARLATELSDGQVIVVRSTLPLHAPDRLAALAGESPVGFAVNPEFLREGRALADFAAPSRIAVGWVRPADRQAAARVAEVYAALDAPVVLADATSVVLVKIASNVYLGLKIAFADELARLADAIGADISTVADGLGLDPRIGRAFLDSGPGFGGSCLPEQAELIAAEAARRNVAAPLLSSIWPSNQRHQVAVVEHLEQLVGRPLAGARIGLLGLAFKAGTNDVRHSPALALAAELRSRGAIVTGFDPAASSAARAADPALATAATGLEAAAEADALVIATEWPEFRDLDWPSIAKAMRGALVYDTRRLVDPAVIAAAGLRYVALGRAAFATTGSEAVPAG